MNSLTYAMSFIYVSINRLVIVVVMTVIHSWHRSIAQIFVKFSHTEGEVNALFCSCGVSVSPIDLDYECSIHYETNVWWLQGEPPLRASLNCISPNMYPHYLGKISWNQVFAYLKDISIGLILCSIFNFIAVQGYILILGLLKIVKSYGIIRYSRNKRWQTYLNRGMDTNDPFLQKG